MADNQNFESTVESLFKGMEGMITSKTVVGEPMKVGDTTVLPLMDVTFGIGAGTGEGDKKSSNQGGGMGGKMTPSALLVIQDGAVRMVPVKNQDSVSKIVDLVPEIWDKVTGKIDERKAKKEAET